MGVVALRLNLLTSTLSDEIMRAHTQHYVRDITVQSCFVVYCIIVPLINREHEKCKKCKTVMYTHGIQKH